MKLPKFLRLPESRRRQRSKARSEVGPTEGQSEVDPATPRPTEPTPDLRVGASISPPPSPLTAHDQESNGMQTIFSRPIHLSHPLHNTDPYTNSDQIPPAPGGDGSSRPKPSGYTTDTGAAPENKSDWKSTAYAATKLAINLAKESSDVFPPLKSVAGGLAAILGHCGVRQSPPNYAAHDTHNYPRKRSRAVKQ